MCFRAGANFTVGVVLTATASATLRQVRKKNELLFECLGTLVSEGP